MRRRISLVLIIICVFLFISIASGQEGNCDTKDEYEKAIEGYDRALQINPDDADAWLNKGMTLKKMGKSYEGARCIERAIILYMCR